MNWVLHILDPATIGALAAEFQSEMQQPAFWVAVGKIFWINVLLSGDNALVIALACRGLAPRQRLWGMIFGAAAAVVLRIIFTGIVVTLMEWPYLKLVGGLALVVIAAKLLVPEGEDEEGVESASHLWAAVQIVVVADIVMSLDNVIAVAAAANGRRVPRCWAGSPATLSRPIRRFTRSCRRFSAGCSASSLTPCWRRSGCRRTLRTAATWARSFAPCWAPSSCWSRDRSGAGTACGTPNIPRHRPRRPNALRSIRSGRPALPIA